MGSGVKVTVGVTAYSGAAQHVVLKSPTVNVVVEVVQ